MRATTGAALLMARSASSASGIRPAHLGTVIDNNDVRVAGRVGLRGTDRAARRCRNRVGRRSLRLARGTREQRLKLAPVGGGSLNAQLAVLQLHDATRGAQRHARAAAARSIVIEPALANRRARIDGKGHPEHTALRLRV